jgi:DNA topoisomerase-1
VSPSGRRTQTRIRRVACDQPGIERVRRGRGFGYRWAFGERAGQPVRDPEVLDRIRDLTIPPAWQDVWICSRADGHLQATGRDARGRKQYRYHADWQAGRGQTKFDGLLRFGQVLPRIRARVQRELAGRGRAALPTRGRVLATLVRLLDSTWLRIGNARYARDNGSFGLSTLRNRHAGVRGDALRLSFVGKAGVRHEARLADPRVAAVVRRCRELPGQELFQYVDDAGGVHRIDSSDVNAWLSETAGVAVTAKDFRTWHGSVQALELTLAACAEGAGPCGARDILAGVAHRLGNTPAVCRKAYIHPRVLALGVALTDEAERAALRGQPWARQAPVARGLTASERRLLALLRSRQC